jgi:membrane-associated phospholipid phosphatase
MDTSLRRALTVVLLTFFVFVYLAGQVVLGGHAVAVIDPAVAHWLAARRSHELTAFLTLITQVHSTLGIDLMVACMAAFVGLAKKRWRTAAWLVLAVESSMLLNVGLKEAFARQRPNLDTPLVHLGTYSFPSGHALASTVLWACVWLLLPTGKAKMLAGFGLALMVLLVCLSRVYLGAHFLTDVIAGVTEGLFCAAAWSLALPQFNRRSSQPSVG